MKILLKPVLWFAALFLLFLWLVLLNPPSAFSQEPAYCFAVYPDYQYQSSGGDVNKLKAVPTWIAANKATYCPNMLFSVSTGDDVDTSNSTQWATYVGSSSTGFFDPIQLLGLPFGSDIGNHDYESASPASRVTTQFTSNLLTSSNGIQNEATYGGAWGGAVQDPEVNYWMQIPSGSYTIGLLFLEFCPRTAALAWGAGIIAAHPGFSDWWVFTHEAVTAAGALSTTGSSGTSGCQANAVDGVNDSTIGGGDKIWAALQGYPNVRGIFNGHFGGGVGDYAAHTILTGSSGNSVLGGYVNHQYDTAGSGGGAQTCLTLYNITPGSTTMGVQANTPCPNYNGTSSFAWLPSGNTADGANNYAVTLSLSNPTCTSNTTTNLQEMVCDCSSGCTDLVIAPTSTTTPGNTLSMRMTSNVPIPIAPTDSAGNPWKLCVNPSTTYYYGCYAASNGAQYAWIDVVLYAGATSSISLGNFTFTGTVVFDEIAAGTANLVDNLGSANVLNTNATTGLTASVTTTGTNDLLLCAIAYPATPTLGGSVTTVNYNDAAAHSLFASATEASAGTYTCAPTWTSTTGSPAIALMALQENATAPTLFPPLLSPVTGRYGPTQTVTMGSAGRTYPPSPSQSYGQNVTSYAPQASVHYTITAGTTGTTPTCSSTLYNPSSQPTVAVTSTVEAIACSGGMTSSAVSTSVITITGVLTPTTYYVLANGGTQAQCTGKANLVYPGSGSAQNCAWGDFRWAYTNGTSGNNAWVMQGGDTLIVDAATDWRVGFNSGASSSDTTYCNGLGNTACYPPPLPTGTSAQPTQLLGSNYASCNQFVTNSNYFGPYCTTGMNCTGSMTSNATQIHGGYGVNRTLNLNGSSYVNLQCLEITSHNGVCTKQGTPAVPRSCNTTPPIDDYSYKLITTDPNTANVTFQDMWIHNGQTQGLYGPFGAGINMRDVLIAFNVGMGWNMDDSADFSYSIPDPIGATLTQNYVWYFANGCNETYPTAAGFPALSCYDDGAGDGFGDSWSGQNTELTTFYLNHGGAAYNTKDGDVGPHTRTLNMTKINSQFYANGGQQQKFGSLPNGTLTMENDQINGNCRRLSSAPPGFTGTWSSVGYFGDQCRAAGDNIAPYVAYGENFLIANTDITGYAATVFDFNCYPYGACATATVAIKNVIFNGYSESTYNGGQSPGAYVIGGTNPSITITHTYNDYYNMKTCPTLGTGEFCTNPAFTNQPASPITAESQLDSYNFSLTSGSPAKWAGIAISGLTTDFNGYTWHSPPSMGSLEGIGVALSSSSAPYFWGAAAQ